MEYGLRLMCSIHCVSQFPVLILVVMEYGLRQVIQRAKIGKQSLNPCCNGIWSQT